MATGAVVIRWGASIPGREAKSLEVFGQAVERMEQLAKDGRIHSHKEFLTLTGPVGGFMLIEGEVDELQKILIEPETIALNMKAETIVAGFEQQLFVGGSDQTVQEAMGTYVESLQQLGYI